MGVEFETRLYLKEPFSENELKTVIHKLGISPKELLRTKETIFKENFKDKDLSDQEIMQAMLDHPKLIERPIVVNNDRAVIGRPPSSIKDIF
ncbi:putative protein YfgD [Parvicella tangerina]|uniref:Arsenate reductase (Glutaredoxin) n=2 Tax=Parvicella tangerina TaxID=2829795 RepID=A0A916NFB0_9FLAO|nr:putative protein YfgD [Parvicella tangerina]